MKFSIAYRVSIEMLLLIEYLQGKVDIVNSKILASYLDIPASSCRKIMSQLSKYGIIESKMGGEGGVKLLKTLNEITLYDAYMAVEYEGSLMRFDRHQTENTIVLQKTMENDFIEIEKSMEDELKAHKLLDYYFDYVKDVKKVVDGG